jgi:hypothetical protein
LTFKHQHRPITQNLIHITQAKAVLVNVKPPRLNKCYDTKLHTDVFQNLMGARITLRRWNRVTAKHCNVDVARLLSERPQRVKAASTVKGRKTKSSESVIQCTLPIDRDKCDYEIE